MTLSALSAYVLAAMLFWVPPSNHKYFGISEEETQARYESIANDIASVAMEADEAPLFKVQAGVSVSDDEGRAFNAILLAAIAKHESDFRKHIDEGKCRKNECDHGRAFSMWQVLPEGGIFLTPNGEWNYAFRMSDEWRREHSSEIITGAAMINDRKLAIRSSLHMVRQSIKNVGHLGVYTGEITNGPKAKLRMYTARKWVKDNPFPEKVASLID